MDAKQTLALRPDWARAWSRVGAAMHGVRDLETAYIYYCKGIMKCPGASELVQARWALLSDLCKWDSILASARENRWYANHATMALCLVQGHPNPNPNPNLCKWDSILASARENRWYANHATMALCLVQGHPLSPRANHATMALCLVQGHPLSPRAKL